MPDCEETQGIASFIILLLVDPDYQHFLPRYLLIIQFLLGTNQH